MQQATDPTDRHPQSRLRRLFPVPRAPRSRRWPSAVSEPGGRGRPPQRLRRWRERAAGCWRTVSVSSGRRRRALPRWRSGRLMATTSAVSFYSHCLSFCLSVSFFLSLSLPLCAAKALITATMRLHASNCVEDSIPRGRGESIRSSDAHANLHSAKCNISSVPMGTLLPVLRTGRPLILDYFTPQRIGDKR